MFYFEDHDGRISALTIVGCFKWIVSATWSVSFWMAGKKGTSGRCLALSLPSYRVGNFEALA